MTDVDYTYQFEDVGRWLGPVLVIDHQKHTQIQFVAAINDTAFHYASVSELPVQIADLVDIGLSVYTADRVSQRRGDYPRRIHIQLPVRCPDLFNQVHLIDRLQDVLFFYTGDHWFFSFRPRVSGRRPAELQHSMLLKAGEDQETEVALWSGGLDSLAGLWLRSQASPQTRRVLFGTGPNTFIHHVQQKVAQAVRREAGASINLVQLPLSLMGVNKFRRPRAQRSRGFVFLLLGAVCASLEGQHSLFIYENGVGAINLPCRQSEVGLDHSRAVHPLGLLKMGALVSHLLETDFTFENPFLFATKGEMCSELTQIDARKLVFKTVTCDSRLRRLQQPIQCGRCSSCILRRQALAVAGIPDTTQYAHTILDQTCDRRHLEPMLFQVERLRECFVIHNPWQRLKSLYPVLETITLRMAREAGVDLPTAEAGITHLYQQYVQEWDTVRNVADFGSGVFFRKTV